MTSQPTPGLGAPGIEASGLEAPRLGSPALEASGVEAGIEARASTPAPDSGAFLRFGECLGDAFRYALARLPERLPLFAAALAGGVLVALFGPGRHVATLTLVMATTIMVVGALAFGVRALRDDAHRGFLYARSMHGSAIFWGEFLAAMATAAGLGALVVLPTFLRTLGDPVRREALAVYWPLLAILPFAFLFTHTVLGLAETKPRWWIASLVLAGVAAVAFVFVGGGLASWTAERATQILIGLIAIGIGLVAPLAAAHRRAELGRADRAACHRAFFRTYWSLVALCVVAALGLFTAVETIEPGDLEPTVWQVSPTGRWVAMRAHVDDDATGLLAEIRHGASAQFVLDTEERRWTRLASASDFLTDLAYVRKTHFSADGDTLIWETLGPRGRGDGLVALDLVSGETTSFQRPADLPTQWWVGPAEKLLIGWDVRFQRPETEHTPRRWTVESTFRAYELGSALPFASWTWTAERRANAFFGLPPSIEATATGAEVRLLEHGTVQSAVLELGERRIVEHTSIRLEPPTDRQIPETIEPFGLAGLQWDRLEGGLWVAHGPRLFRLAEPVEGPLDPATAVHEEPAGRWIWDVLVLPDRILLTTLSSLPGDSAQALPKEVVVLPRDNLAARRVVASIPDTLPSFLARLTEDSIFLGPFNDAGQRVLVLGSEPGTGTVVPVMEWAADRGLAATDRIRMPFDWLGNPLASPRDFATSFTTDGGQILLPRGDELTDLRAVMAETTRHRPLETQR